MSIKLPIAAIALALLAVYAAQSFSGSTRDTSSEGKRQGGGNKHRAYSSNRYSLTPPKQDQLGRLAADLTPEEQHVLLEEGTERAFTGVLVENKKEGIYTCRLCGLPLYNSDAKFESGTGWPSFFKPFDPDHVREERDTKFGRVRDRTNLLLFTRGLQ